ncbi:hypothetical protein [Jeotgalibacillus marinus]|uniref:Uncharacterized protein n=1 Tax=Jeotgalibacillus marinus TaxID=86667 RepID=A0ABV3Q818_9BACL
MKRFSKLIIYSIMMISIFIPIESYAATNKVELEYLDINEVNPNPYYSWGDNPAVTVLDNGLILSVSDYKGDLTYTLGEYYNGKVYWKFPEAYDTGKKPSITTLDNGDVMEVHQGNGFMSGLFYNLGRYDENNNIDWYSVGNLLNPLYGGESSIESVDGTQVIAFQNPYNEIEYIMGVYEDRDFQVKSEGHGGLSYFSVTPNITKVDNKIIDFHKSYWNDGLWYTFAGINHDYFNLSPRDSVKFDDHGKDPVGLQLDNGIILTMFEGTRGGNSPTWYRTGELEDDTIRWTSSTFAQFDGTDNDVVQLKNGYLLNVHKDPNGPSLRYVIGTWDEEANRVWWWINGL